MELTFDYNENTNWLASILTYAVWQVAWTPTKVDVVFFTAESDSPSALVSVSADTWNEMVDRVIRLSPGNFYGQLDCVFIVLYLDNNAMLEVTFIPE